MARKLLPLEASGKQGTNPTTLARRSIQETEPNSTSLSTIIELNAKINAYDEGKIKEDDLKDYINDLYDRSFNVLQDPSISD